MDEGRPVFLRNKGMFRGEDREQLSGWNHGNAKFLGTDLWGLSFFYALKWCAWDSENSDTLHFMTLVRGICLVVSQKHVRLTIISIWAVVILLLAKLVRYHCICIGYLGGVRRRMWAGVESKWLKGLTLAKELTLASYTSESCLWESSF